MNSSSFLFARWIHFALSAALVFPGPAFAAGEADLGATVRQFEIVPCLLPARIRKLGSMAYPERRRLIETSALECELKGGEYTFYDRAAPDSAAAFFKTLADEGNLDAQVSLGDVYQYLYAEPDYEQAAHWYRTAMEGGSARGQMQLARLYERGLGVPKDGLMATNLWRAATGAGEELVLASELQAARTEADRRVAELTEALRVRSEEAAQIRGDLALAQRDIEARKASLAAAEVELAAARSEFEGASAATVADPAELTALRDKVAGQQRHIEDQRFQIDSLEADMGVQQAQLSASLRQAELQNQRLNQELDRVTSKADEDLQAALASVQDKDNQLSVLQTQVKTAQAELERTTTEYDKVVADLDLAREHATGERNSDDHRIAELEKSRADQQARLETQRTELASLREDLAAASSETTQLKQSLDKQVHATEKAEAQFASAEAELQSTRDKMSEVSSELEQASAQLARLDADRTELRTRLAAGTGEAANSNALQQRLAAQDEQVAQQEARIGELEASVERYRSELTEINLRRASYAKRTPMEDTSHVRLPRDVKIGRYYALVIGNNDYQYLNDLTNAANDAQAVDHVLREEYGFESTLLINATEKQIFQAFQELAGKTVEEDMVLIYYAGHGYEIKNESYWLPVEVQSRREAELSGISSLKVADWVRAMAANHVMIIADSCYSGSGIETTGGFRYSPQDLEKMLPYFLKSRSRTMLTSGGLSPVMDGDGSGGGFSIFTKELVGLLKENRGVLYGEALYDHLLERVKFTPDGMAVNQTPMFGSIESAGHECGQFVLVRPSMRT